MVAQEEQKGMMEDGQERYILFLLSTNKTGFSSDIFLDFRFQNSETKRRTLEC